MNYISQITPGAPNLPNGTNAAANICAEVKPVGPAVPPASEPVNLSADQLSSRLSQLEIRPAKPGYSKAEQAFMKAFDLPEQDYRELKPLCRLDAGDDLTGLMRKAGTAENTQPVIEKAWARIVEFDKYQDKAAPIGESAYKAAEAAFEQPTNTLIALAFADTLKAVKDDKYYHPYFAILDKYQIREPLFVTRPALDRMTVLEETEFTRLTESLKYTALSNLDFAELQQYLQLQAEKREFRDQLISSDIAAKHQDLLPFRQREAAVQEILKQEDNTGLALEALSGQARALIERFRQASDDLRAALKTEDPADDQAVQARLDAVRREIVGEVAREYTAAFVEAPSEPEKQALKALLKMTARLAINDRQIIYYARLSSSSLTELDRTAVEACRHKAWQRPGLDPLDYQKLSPWQLVDRFPLRVRPALVGYVAALKEDFRKEITTREVSSGDRAHSTALFYALQSAGFPEKELLIIQAAVAYEHLKPEARELLTGTADEQFNKCLKRFIRLMDQSYSGGYSRLDRAEQEKISAEKVALYWIFNGLAGSQVTAEYLWFTRGEKRATGAMLEVQFMVAEDTSEENDDLPIRKGLSDFFKLGAAGSLDHWQLLGDHIMARRLLGEPIDQEFVTALLENSPIFGADGEYGLESFKHDLVNALTFLALEINSRDKPNCNSYKNKLRDWMRDFVAKIREDIANDPHYSGSAEMENKLAISAKMSRLLIDAKLFREDEIARFFQDNPLVAARSGLSTEDFKTNGVFRTVGYDDLPQEVKAALSASPAGQTVRQHSELLNVYWVPYERSNSGIDGFATYDKSTIVVVYQEPDQTLSSREEITTISVHELRHKIDAQELRDYLAKEPDRRLPFKDPPSLITERNAYIEGLNYLEALPARSGKTMKTVKFLSETVSKANLLLGRPEADREMLHPPYAGIDFDSPLIYFNPADSVFPAKQIKKIIAKIGSLDYPPKERKWLLETCLLIGAGKVFDAAGVPAGRRNLLIEFFDILMGDSRLISHGMAQPEFLRAIKSLNAAYGLAGRNTEITPPVLYALLFRTRQVIANLEKHGFKIRLPKEP
jgi:hypothetical protein